MIPNIVPVNTWAGNSSTTTFDFDFLIEDASELQVLHTANDGTQTTLQYDIDYSINQIGSEDGSFITFPITGSTYPLLASDEKISLILNLPCEQTSPYGTSTKLDLKAIEHSFDYLTRLVQIYLRRLERAVKIPEGSDIDTDQLTINLTKVANIANQVASVAGSVANVVTVAGSISNVNTVAGDIQDVNAVAGDIQNVNAVADDLTNIDAVNANKTNIDAVAGSISDVNTVADISSDISTVADNVDIIDTVADSINDVNAVGSNIQNVNAVADNATNINAVKNNATNINLVANSISDVNAVGGSIANVNAVALDLTNIDAVNANKTNIDAVAGISSNVTTVANNSGIVTYVAANMSKISTVNSNITNINNVVDNLTTINAVANDLTNIDNASENATLAGKWANYMGGTVDGNEFSAKYYAQQAADHQIQANWNETTTTSKAYIQNKPEIISYEVTDNTNVELYAWTKAWDSSTLYTKAVEGEDLTVYAIVDGVLTDIADEGYVDEGELWYEDSYGTEYYATRNTAGDVTYKSVKLKDGTGVAIYPEAVWG